MQFFFIALLLFISSSDFLLVKNPFTILRFLYLESSIVCLTGFYGYQSALCQKISVIRSILYRCNDEPGDHSVFNICSKKPSH